MGRRAPVRVLELEILHCYWVYGSYSSCVLLFIFILGWSPIPSDMFLNKTFSMDTYRLDHFQQRQAILSLVENTNKY